MLCRRDTECWLKINSMACYADEILNVGLKQYGMLCRRDTECWLKINSMACYADEILNVGLK